MNKKLYTRGMTAQYWYNFTEALVHCLLLRPTPDELIYTKKIKYGKEPLQYINMYEREDLKGRKKPLLIYIHGGSWVSGITEMRNPYISYWAKMGFKTAAISYSYAPQRIFPYQLQEMFDAIDFLIDNSDKFEIDTDNIVLAGESAGGYFISYASSVIKNRNALAENNLVFNNADKFKVKGIVSISGCNDLKRLTDPNKPQSHFPDLKTMIKTYLGMEYDDAVKTIMSEKGKYISPTVNDGYPPSFIIWGDKDLLRYEAFDFSEDLRKHGVPNKLYKADGAIGMHAWAIVPLFKKTHDCLKETFDYILPLIDKYFIKDAEGNWKFK